MLWTFTLSLGCLHSGGAFVGFAEHQLPSTTLVAGSQHQAPLKVFTSLLLGACLSPMG